MANLNLGQDVAKKEKDNRQLLMAKSYPQYQSITMCRYSSLINI